VLVSNVVDRGFVKVNVLASNVVDRGFVKVNVLASNVVDRGFVKVNVLVSNVVDRGFVKVNVLVSNVVDRGFEARLCKTKDYEIVICCFYAKHAAFRSKSKDWLTRNQDNVYEWGDMFTRGLFFK
jgi:hypothetical protein